MGEEKKCEKEKGGELLFCGSTSWDRQAGKVTSGTEGKLYAPTRLHSLVGIDIRYVASGCISCHCVALDVDGRCYTWGQNKMGQLGHGDRSQRDRPTVVSALSEYNIVTASAGRSHTVVVTDDGQSFAFGWNKHGQLGSGSLKNEFDTSPVSCQLSDITVVACGGDFTIWLSSVQGASILSAGLPQYGQLGHGTDNEYNTKVSSVKLAYEPQPRPKAIASFSGEAIAKVACGTNHTVAVDSNGFVYTWGNGGYGRLGHREQKDEFSPRLVDVFARHNVLPPDAVISAGAANSACTAAGGQLYMWGKVKRDGDEWMYPKPVMDLSGWNLRCMGSGYQHYFVGAESSCISWGIGLNGELGHGSLGQKSSGTPKKVDSLEGMHAISVTCGLSHSMVVVDRTDIIDCLEQFDVYEGKAPKEGTVVVEPVIPAKKTPKKVSANNSQKRNKSKDTSDTEVEKDDEEQESDVDDNEEMAVNGNSKKKLSGGKASGRGRGRPRKTVSADNSKRRKKLKDTLELEQEEDDEELAPNDDGDNGSEEAAVNGNSEKKQSGGKAGGRGRGHPRKTVSVDNSNKRKKSKDTSDLEEENDEEQAFNDDGSEEVTVKNAEKRRGGKAGGRGSGRPRKNSAPEANSSGRGSGRSRGRPRKSG